MNTRCSHWKCDMMLNNGACVSVCVSVSVCVVLLISWMCLSQSRRPMIYRYHLTWNNDRTHTQTHCSNHRAWLTVAVVSCLSASISRSVGGLSLCNDWHVIYCSWLSTPASDVLFTWCHVSFVVCSHLCVVIFEIWFLRLTHFLASD